MFATQGRAQSAALIALLASAACLGACKGDDDGGSITPPPHDGGDDPTGSDPGETGETGEETGEGGDSGSTGDDSPTNCGQLVCRGHGSCQVDGDTAQCVCDEGYILNPEDDTECIVDESCVQLRFLEDHCRQVYNGTPAVALFFAVDFCSGTAVLPERLAELGLEFKILEDGNDISDNEESSAKVVEGDVESYVSLVLDASDSVTSREDLPMLVAELRRFVTSLAPAPGRPPVHVSVHVFARRVRKLIEFTTDLAAVDSRLAALAANPDLVLDGLVRDPGGWNGMGTSLFPAVVEGIHETDRARHFRDAVTEGGVLTTGTVVIVTDGNDTSNEDLPDALIGSTLNQVISVGISTLINGSDLDTIGRDGSFLAPTPADWTVAFQEITERVEQYPQRAYLLAYCSSLISGQAEVTVTLEGSVIVQKGAGCRFNADAFAADPPVCTTDFFDTECNSQECGGLTACGACANDECCVGGQCTAPASLDPCNGVDHMCRPGEGICLESTCGPGQDVGDACGSGQRCTPGVAYCNDSDLCVGVSDLGVACESPLECSSLNCWPDKPENVLDPDKCQEPARAYDDCSMGHAICERGAFCSSSTCLPLKWWFESCGNSGECISGQCDTMAHVCLPSPVCSMTWDEALGA